MKFAELKTNLTKEIFPVYLVMGEDDFLCESSINLIEKQIFGEILRNNLNKQIFSTENTDNKKIFDNLNTMPFFAEKKLVIYKQYDEKISNDFISQLKEYVKFPNSSTVLVIQALNKTDAFKCIISNVTIVECNRLDNATIKKWINSKVKLQGKQIDLDAMELLISYTNGYLSKISNEIEKLIAYCTQTISVQDVKNLVNKDLEYSVFELTDAIINKNTNLAIRIKNDLMSNRKTFSAVLSVLSSYFRRLFMSLVSNETTNDIASLLGVKEFAVIKAKEQAKKLGAVKLKCIMELSAELDYKTKTSEIKLENATDYLLAYLLGL